MNEKNELERAEAEQFVLYGPPRGRNNYTQQNVIEQPKVYGPPPGKSKEISEPEGISLIFAIILFIIGIIALIRKKTPKAVKIAICIGLVIIVLFVIALIVSN